MTVHEVLDRARAHLNDSLGQIYSDDKLLPHLQTAYDELEEMFQENGLPTTNKVTTSPNIVVAAGLTSIGDPTVGPALPADLVEIQGVYERTNGTSEPFMSVTRVDFLPTTPTPPLSQFIYYAWQNQIIHFLAANSIREIKLEYIADTFSDLVSPSSLITVIKSKNSLAYRTAGLAAFHIGENESRANELNGFAGNATERLMNIMMKGQQAIVTRRRPFRAAYKSQSY